jgi:hypothetical protein
MRVLETIPTLDAKRLAIQWIQIERSEAAAQNAGLNVAITENAPEHGIAAMMAWAVLPVFGLPIEEQRRALAGPRNH